MYLYDSSLIFGLWTLVSCVSVPPTTEQDALLVSTPLPNLQDSLRKHLIIPDLLRIGPDYVLNMMYGNKSVTVGNEFTLEDLGLEPTSIHYTCREDAFHTLIVVGLDVPTQKNHTEREWVHWIQVNIPAYNITSGETVVPYQGPGSSYGYALSDRNSIPKGLPRSMILGILSQLISSSAIQIRLRQQNWQSECLEKTLLSILLLNVVRFCEINNHGYCVNYSVDY
nr:PREDICTED: OV-16 antigen-like isoform X1 [Bemisia tabaci]